MSNVNFGLKNSVALVTGGSRGIGKEIAFQMAREGARVAICGRKQENLATAAAEFQKEGLDVATFAAHIAKGEQVSALMNWMEEKFEGIDILVNNVGMNIFTPSVLAADESLFDKVIETNLKGTFLVCKYALPLIRKRKGGKIINVTSVAAQRAAMGMGIYGIAKAGVEMFTKTLAVELAPNNIQVNAVAPAMVRTEFSKPFWGNEAVHTEIVKSIPMGRIAEPEEVAGAVLFLASSAAQFITGEVLTVAGGSSAR